MLRGVFALVLGILALIWPGVTFTTMIIFLGAYLFIDGLFAIVGAVGARKTSDNWGLFLLSGLLGVLLGILTLVNPFVTGAALIYLVAFWALLAGLLEIILAIRLRKVITGEGLVYTGRPADRGVWYPAHRQSRSRRHHPYLDIRLLCNRYRHHAAIVSVPFEEPEEP